MLDRAHVSEHGFRGAVLFFGPSDRTEKNAHSIEIMNVPKLTKYAPVEIRLQVENTLSAILDLDINLKVGQRFLQ